jgi:hypothetical protein
VEPGRRSGAFASQARQNDNWVTFEIALTANRNRVSAVRFHVERC